MWKCFFQDWMYVPRDMIASTFVSLVMIHISASAMWDIYWMQTRKHAQVSTYFVSAGIYFVSVLWSSFSDISQSPTFEASKHGSSEHQKLQMKVGLVWKFCRHTAALANKQLLKGTVTKGSAKGQLIGFDIMYKSMRCELFFSGSGSGSDACSQGHDCQHICANNGYSYICKCRVGFVLNMDQKTCSRKKFLPLIKHCCSTKRWFVHTSS